MNVAFWPALILPMSDSSTLVSNCIFVRSCAISKIVGAANDAATVWPTSMRRAITVPSTGAVIRVCVKIDLGLIQCCSATGAPGPAQNPIAPGSRRPEPCADWMVCFDASICDWSAATWASAASVAALATSSSLSGMIPCLKRPSSLCPLVACVESIGAVFGHHRLRSFFARDCPRKIRIRLLNLRRRPSITADWAEPSAAAA